MVSNMAAETIDHWNYQYLGAKDGKQPAKGT